MNSIVLVGIIGIGVIAAITIFGSISSEIWNDHRTGFTGVAQSDEIDEKMDCLSKGGTWEYNNCVTEWDTVPQIQKTQTCSGSKLCITEKIIKIIDGDTIYTEHYKIRFSLVDTPEVGDPRYQEAKSFTEMTCPVGSIVTIDQDDFQPYDVYDRMLGKVYCENGVINEQLMQNGLAKISTQYCRQSEFSGEFWAQYGCNIETTLIEPVITGESNTPKKSSDCDPSYPDVCIAPYPPDLDCEEIPYKNFRVIGSDLHGFDGDHDRIGCKK